MVTITKKTKIKSVDKERKGNSCIIFTVETGASAIENNVKFPQKIKYRTIIGPSNSTSGYFSK